MNNLMAFPADSEVDETAAEPDIEAPELDETLLDLLKRWQNFGAEVKRQCSSDLNFDLHLELSELDHITFEILN